MEEVQMAVGARLAEKELRLEGFVKAVITYVDDDGYPMSVPASFEAAEGEHGVVLDPIATPPGLGAGRRVTVIFSSITPVEGVGYTDRRYVTLEGVLRPAGDRFALVAEKVGGWDEAEVPFFEYCERSVGRAHRYMKKLEARRGEPVAPKLSLPWKVFLATRVPFLSATVIPVALGAVVARWQGHSAWWAVAAALVGASLIHLGLNMLNDVYDSVSGADEANVNPTPYSGGSRVIQYGLVSRRTMFLWAAGLIAAGAAIGVVLAVLRGYLLLPIGALGLFLAIFYSAPPFKLAYRGLGDLAVALGFGPIVVLGSYYVAARSVSAEAFYASIPVAILVMLILYVNQVPDRKADAAAGKATVAVRFSRRAIVVGYGAAAVAAFVSIVIGVLTGLMPVTSLAALVAAPLAVAVYRGLERHYDDPYALMPVMARNVALHGLVGAMLVGAYAAAVVFGL